MKLPTIADATRALIEIAIGAAVVGVLAFAVWHFALRGREVAEQRGAAIVQQETARATGEAAASAVTITTEVHREITRIDEITRRNDHDITTATGAEARAPGVAAALRGGLCLRAVYQSDPACAAPVPTDGGSVGPAERDAWGAPP